MRNTARNSTGSRKAVEKMRYPIWSLKETAERQRLKGRQKGTAVNSKGLGCRLWMDRAIGNGCRQRLTRLCGVTALETQGTTRQTNLEREPGAETEEGSGSKGTEHMLLPTRRFSLCT